MFCFAYDLSYFVNNVTPTVIHIWDISKSAPKKHQVIISKLEKEWKKEEKKSFVYYISKGNITKCQNI